jgi:hypothetical protein
MNDKPQIDEAAIERRRIVAYMRHLADLRPADANGLQVVASDVEAGFHLDPELNPNVPAPDAIGGDERLVVVAMGEPVAPGGLPTVILGMPTAAWAHMASGLTHTFDLTSIGVRTQLIIFRGYDRAAVMRQLGRAAESLGAPLADLGIKEPTQQ